MNVWVNGGQTMINHFIKLIYPNCTIEWKNDNNCDLIVKSVFPQIEKEWNIYNKKYLYWIGESYIPIENDKQTNKLYIITHIDNTIDNLYVPFFLYSAHLYKNRIANNINRKYLLAYCNSHKIKEREEMYNLFVEKADSKLCHSYGSCYGKYPNTRVTKIKGGWNDNDLINFYKNYKFVIAMENKCTNGYITEKIVNAFYSGAIPIYWGSSNINNFFNKNAFINVNDFKSFEECVNYVINMTDEQIEKMSNEPIYVNNDLCNLLNDEYNKNNDNKILKKYIDQIKNFLDN